MATPESPGTSSGGEGPSPSTRQPKGLEVKKVVASLSKKERLALLNEIKSQDFGLDVNDPNQMKEYSNKGPLGMYAQWLTKLWWCFMPVFLAVYLAPIALVFATVDEPFQLDTGHSAFRVQGHVATDQYDAFETARKSSSWLVVDPSRRRLNERLYSEWEVVLVYVTNDESNILTETNLKKVRAIENSVLAHCPSGQGVQCYSQWCRMDAITGACRPPNSVLNYFYPTQIGGNVYFDGKGVEFVGPVESTLDYLAKSNILGFFHKDFKEGNLTSPLVKTILEFGSPRPGFTSPYDRQSTQEGQWESYIEQWLPFLQGLSAEGITVIYGGDHLTEYEFFEVLERDLMFALGSLAFVFLYMWFHTTSLFLAVVGILGIFLSFSPAYYVYRVTYGQKYMGVMNLLAIFIILGIGVDDVFVFTDLFSQTKETDKHGNTIPTAGRMACTLRRAGSAMFVTTLTTSVAFFANMVSAVPPIRDFGLFMGVLTVSNYIEVMTLYPCLLLLWVNSVGRIFGRSRLVPSKATKLLLSRLALESTFTTASPSPVGAGAPDDEPSNEVPPKAKGPRSEAQLKRLSSSIQLQQASSLLDKCANEEVSFVKARANARPSFWNSGTSDLSSRFWNRTSGVFYKGRWLVIVAFLVLVGGAVYNAIKLRPAEEPPRFLPKTHNIERLKELEKDDIQSGETYDPEDVTATIQTCSVDGCPDPSTPAVIGTDPGSGGTGVTSQLSGSSATATQFDVALPGMPTAPEITRITPNSVLITWAAPPYTGTTPLEKTTCQRTFVKESISASGSVIVCDSAQWENVFEGSAEEVEYTMEGLELDETYCFRVSFTNGGGDGQFSQGAWVRTQAQKPGPPIMPESPLTEVDGGVQLSWNIPEWTGPDGADTIVEYLVETRATDGDRRRLQESGWDVLYQGAECTSQLTIQSSSCGASACCRVLPLCVGSAIDLRVSARNSFGLGTPADLGSYQTPSVSPPSQPQAVACVGGERSAVCSFVESLCANGYTITSYKAFYTDQELSDALETWTAIGDQQPSEDWSIDGLKSDTRHYVAVVPNTEEEGLSTSFSTATFTTLISVPTTPEILSVDPRTYNAEITFQTAERGGELSDYRLEIDGVLLDGASFENVVLNEDESGIVTLFTQPNTNYEISIALRNEAGWSDFSAPVLFNSGQSAPSPPSLAVEGEVLGQVTVHWSTDQDGGSEIQEYELQWSGALDAVDSSFSWQLLDLASPLSTSHDVLTSQDRHFYLRVRASNSLGASDWSESLYYLAASQNPGKMDPVTAENVAIGEASVSWDPPSYQGAGVQALEYTLELKESASGSWSAVFEGAALSTQLTAIATGETIFLRASASNEFGAGEVSDEVQLETLSSSPSAPSQPSVAVVTSSSVLVTWTEPSDLGSGLDRYEVEYKKTADPTWSDPTRVAGDTLELLVESLELETEYDYRVYACAVEECSKASSVATALSGTSFPAEPSKPTFSVGVDNTEVEISWDAPSYIGPDGATITQYQLESSTDDGDSWSIAFQGSTSTFTFESLVPAQSYEFRVAATNDASPTMGPYSSVGKFVSGSDPPSIPASLALSLGENGIEVSWTEPVDDGGSPVVKYELVYKLSSENEFTVLEYANTLQFTFDSGEFGSEYDFKVRAESGSGFGEFTGVESITVPVQVPGSPTLSDPTTWTVEHSLVTLSWDAPTSDGGGLVTSYEIKVWTSGSDEPSDTQDWYQDVGDVLSTTVDEGILPESSYNFRVRSCNSEGCGSPSDVETTTTPSNKPPTPGDPFSTSTKENEITLKWDPSVTNLIETPTYQLEQDSGSGWTQVAVTTDTSVVVNSLTSNTTYSFRVRACLSGSDASTCGDYSAETEVMTAVGTPGPPGVIVDQYAYENNEIVLTLSIQPNLLVEVQSATTNFQLRGENGIELDWSTEVDVSCDNDDCTTTQTVTVTELYGAQLDVTAPGDSTPAYSFQARGVNAAGSGEWSASSTPVNVPRESSSPDNLVSDPAGLTQETVLLKWEVPSYIGPQSIQSYTIQYDLKDGPGDPQSQSVGADSLEVTVDFGDSSQAGLTYTFSVTAVNAAGDLSVAASIDVEVGTSVPSEPLSVAVADAESDRLQISWAAPATDGGKQVASYILSYVTQGGDWAVDGQEISEVTESPSWIPDLESFTDYTIRVAALNEVGESAWSSEVAGKTAEGPPPSPPFSPSGSGRRRLEHGPLSPVETATVEPQQIAKFHPTVPRRRLQSSCGESYSQFSVTWDAVGTENNGGVALESYKVEVRESGGSWPSGTSEDDASPCPCRITVAADNTKEDALGSYTADITDLDEGTDFDVRLRVCNSLGCSGPSSPHNTCATKQASPNPPTLLQPTDVTMTSFSVSWQEPTFHCPSGLPDGTITSCTLSVYSLEIRVDGGDWEVVDDTIPSTTLTQVVDGLSAGVSVQCRVAALNTCEGGDGLCGWSDYSSTVTAVTTVTEPSQVSSVTIGTVTTSAIPLRWTAPESGGSTITGYVVEHWEVGDEEGADSTDVSTTRLDFAPPKTGTTYSLRVRAVNSVGDGAYSSTVDQIVPDCGGDIEGVFCSGSGVCTIVDSQDECVCEDGFVGTQCDLTCPTWSGSVCSGHGSCVGTSTASCSCDDETYVEPYCSPCPGIVDGSACSGHGTCTWDGDSETTTCACDSGYASVSGQSCVACPGLGSSDGVCSGHGDCSAISQFEVICSCNTGYAGTNCNVTAPATLPEPSFDMVASDKAILTWEITSTDVSPIEAFTIEYRTESATDWTQFDIVEGDVSSATIDGLQSFETYLFRVTPSNIAGAASPSSTPSVKLPRCTPEERTGLVCAGSGDCVVQTIDTGSLTAGVGSCECSKGTSEPFAPLSFGDDCQVSCPGTIDQGPCSNLGDCEWGGSAESEATCSCWEGGVGPACLPCPGLVNATGSDSDLVVCSGHGSCFFDDMSQSPVCACEAGYNGTACDPCPGDPICGGFGQCATDAETGAVGCDCDAGRGGDLCEFECPSLCSGNGACNVTMPEPYVCDCYNGYKGEICELACPGVGSNGLACSGHGTCLVNGTTGTTECACEPSHVGPDCSYECPGLVARLQSPCYDNGVCQVSEGGAAECICDAHYGGNDCREGLFPLHSRFYQVVDISWGIVGVDNSQMDPNDADSLGVIELYEGFSLDSPSAQEFLLEVCHDAAFDPTFVRMEDRRCFIEDFKKFMEVSFPDVGFPVPVATNGDQQSFTYYMSLFMDSVSWGSPFEQDVGITTSKDITWVRFSFRSTVEKDQSGTALESHYQVWEDWMDEMNQKAPAGVGPGFQSCELWVRMAVELEFVRGTVSAMGISVGCAFMTIVFFTMSVRSSILATLTILGIVTCVIAYIVLEGWTLGVIEAIAITILVGFSVDYSLHVAHAFNEAPSDKRKDKTRDAIVEMGTSVVSASITTIGATCLLLFTQIQFFVAFGKVVAITSFLSILWTLGFFTASLSIIGPEGHSVLARILALFGKKEAPQQAAAAAAAAPPPPSPTRSDVPRAFIDEYKVTVKDLKDGGISTRPLKPETLFAEVIKEGIPEDQWKTFMRQSLIQ